MSKIIDFERKGNIVRFYLGADDCTDYCGDDWNDRPYEHNAGTVYDKYITEHIDVVFPFDCYVLDAASDYCYQGNSPFSKDDFKAGHAPCLLILPPDADFLYADSYSYNLGNKRALHVYFNDDISVITEHPLATVIEHQRYHISEGETLK